MSSVETVMKALAFHDPRLVLDLSYGDRVCWSSTLCSESFPGYCVPNLGGPSTVRRDGTKKPRQNRDQRELTTTRLDVLVNSYWSRFCPITLRRVLVNSFARDFFVPYRLTASSSPRMPRSRHFIKIRSSF